MYGERSVDGGERRFDGRAYRAPHEVSSFEEGRGEGFWRKQHN
jgi:hypothetical protein